LLNIKWSGSKIVFLGFLLGLLLIIFGNLYSKSISANPGVSSLYAIAGNHSAKLFWKPVVKIPISGYYLYRKLSTDSYYQRITEFLVADTNYIDTSLVNKAIYDYVVTYVDTDSNESEYSNQAIVLPNNWIIFVEDWDIWGMDAVDANGDNVGNNKQQLTFNPAYDITPDLSPDGTRIVFSSKRDGNFELYSMRSLDGGNLTRLTSNTCTDVSPSWSYDGSKIAYSSDQFCNYDIFVKDSIGITQLTTNPGYDGNPAFSPCDGQLTFDTQSDKYLPDLQDGYRYR